MNTKISPEVRAAILAKDKNHVWTEQGFCRYCWNTHRSDFRPNDICHFLFHRKTK